MILKPLIRKLVAFAAVALISYKLYSMHKVGWERAQQHQQESAAAQLEKPVWRPAPRASSPELPADGRPAALPVAAPPPPPPPPPPQLPQLPPPPPPVSALSSMLPWAPPPPAPPVVALKSSPSREQALNKQTNGLIDMWQRYPTLDMTNRWNPPSGRGQGVGSWTQGWDYEVPNGEYERGEKLEIYVIPHSHNDPGWKETFEEWYGQKTGRVLDTMIDFLGSDPRYRFQWSEVSFLQKWWDTNPSKRDKLIKLMRSGQLELTGGGLVMNDEGLTTLYAIIENLHEGRQWVKDKIGVDVVSSWQNDPFGLSATMPYLFNEMGYRGMWVQRVHYRVKWMLAKEKAMEFWWRQHSDTTGSSDMLTHLNPFYAYDVPHTCGPQPGICCQFDFVRMSNSHPYKGCPWNVAPKPIGPNNVAERAATLLDQYRKKSMLYRTRRLIIPLGNDFEYMSPEFAHLQYENYQRLFDHMNGDAKMNVHARFGTLGEYFADLQQTATAPAPAPALPVLQGSFFTYSDREDEFWSGFYSSRPFIKRQARDLEGTLHAAEILREKLGGGGEGEGNLQTARLMLSIFQHHDAITGTASAKTVRDYNSKLHNGLQAAGRTLEQDVAALVGASKVQLLVQRAEQHSLPTRKLVALSQTKHVSIILFNPTGLARPGLAKVLVDTSDVCVDGSPGGEFQISPAVEVRAGQVQIVAGQFEVVVPVQLSPFGLAVLSVRLSGAGESECHPVAASVWDSTGGEIPAAFAPLEHSGEIVFSTSAITAKFDVQGKLKSITQLGDATFSVDVTDSIVKWTDEAKHAGAYLFRPSRPSEMAEAAGGVIAINGKFLSQVFSVASPNAARVATVTAADGVGGRAVGLDYFVDITSGDWGNKEIGLKITSSVKSGKEFYTGEKNSFLSRISICSQPVFILTMHFVWCRSERVPNG